MAKFHIIREHQNDPGPGAIADKWTHREYKDLRAALTAFAALADDLDAGPAWLYSQDWHVMLATRTATVR